MPMTLQEKLERLEQIALRARSHFDIWWVYEGADTRPRFLPAMNKYSEFFRFDEHAHQFTFVVYLCQLLDKGKKTINIRAAIADAEMEAYSSDALRKSRTAVAKMEPVWRKLVLLRNNLFAHRSDRIGWEAAFKKAAVTPDEIRGFMEHGLGAIHALLSANGCHVNGFSEYPKAHVRRLLEELEDAAR